MIRRAALAAAALLLLACGAVAALVASFDIDAWRPRIIAEAERATGRQVAIGGLAMQGWLWPRVTVLDARLANLPGGSGAEMARLPRIELQLSLPALLLGRIEVLRLELERPEILLETVNGVANWSFGAGAAGGPDIAWGALRVRDARIALPAGGVTVAGLGIEGHEALRAQGELRWQDGRLRFDLRGGSLARLLGAAGGPMPVSARLEMPGAELRLSGRLGEARGLRDYAIEVTGEADAAALRRLAALTGRGPGPLPAQAGIRARLAGSGFDWPAEQAIRLDMGETSLGAGVVLSRAVLEADGAQAPLRVSLTGTRLADPFTLDGSLGPWRPGAPVPLDLTGTLLGHRLRLSGAVAEPEAGRGIGLDAVLDSPVLGRVRARLAERGAFFADGLELTAIRADGAGAGEGGLSVSRQGLSGRLALGPVNLDALLPETAPAAPGPARRPAAAARLVPDQPIDLAPLLVTPVALDLSVAMLRHAGQEYRDIAARISIQGQRLQLDPLEITLPGGRMMLRAAAQQEARGAQWQLALHGEGLDLARLLPEASFSGRGELELELRGRGDNWRDLAASLVGDAGLTVLHGQLDGRLVQAFMPPGLGALAPRIDLACLAIRFDVVAGIAQARTLYADTSIGRLNGGGRINLRDETLELRLNTDLRLPLLNAVGVRVRAPVPIGGTLAAPRLDTTALLGGGAAGTVAGMVPGLNQALGVQGMPDCGPPLTVARGGRTGPVPRSLMPAEPAPVQNLLRGLGVR